MSSSSGNKKKKNPLQHFVAGGCAGLVEASICHPLDTIKTRMQLRKNSVDTKTIRNSLVEPAMRLRHSLQDPVTRATTATSTTTVTSNGAAMLKSTATAGAVHEPGFGAPVSRGAAKVIVKPTQHGAVQASLGPIGTARRIVQREGFFALYKGLTAVYTGIIPKMAIRFVSFEHYRELMNTHTSLGYSTSATLIAGLGSGLTEAILVVTPAEVCKIRMQSQYHSLADPSQMKHRKYTNVLQTAATIVKEEGPGALYKVCDLLGRSFCRFVVYEMSEKRLCWAGFVRYSQIATTPKAPLQSFVNLPSFLVVPRTHPSYYLVSSILGCRTNNVTTGL